MASELYTGTHAVDTTEWSCTTDTAGPDADTTSGEYQLFLDVNDMIAGDTLQIRVYEKTRAGDTQRLVQEWILTGAQASPVWASPKLVLMHGWDFTLDALAGTITVLWSIRNADVGAASAPTAAQVADAVWDEDATAHQTQGTFGQAIGDPVADANTIYKAVVTDATGATVGVDVIAIKVDTAAILVDTGTTLDARLPAALTANGNIKADTLRLGGIEQTAGDVPDLLATLASYVDTEVAAILDSVDTGVVAIKSKMDSETILANTAQAGAATTITLNAGASASNNFYNNTLILLTGGTGVGQARFITAYVGATKVATVNAWVTNPNNTTTFVILPFDVVAVVTEVAAIKAKTDSLTFTAAGKVDSNVLMLNGDAVAAATLAILNGTTVVYRGTVTGAATPTTLIDSGLTQADSDWWKGRIIIFTSVITMQATDITSFNPATDQLTFTSVTASPTGASYIII